MLKAIRAALRMMARFVTRTVRLASGAVITFLEMLRPAVPPVDYDDERVDMAIDEAKAVLDRDPELEALRQGGELVRRAAAERLQHGQVMDMTIPAGIRNYVACLAVQELAVLVASRAEDVARHMTGEITLETEFGVPLGRPNEKRDADKVERRAWEKRLREESYGAAMRKRRREAAAAAPAFGMGF